MLLGSTTAQKKKRQINQRHQKLREKIKSGKTTEPDTNPPFIKKITGEKKRILTVALYNDTHNSMI